MFQRLDFAPGANAETAAQQGPEPADQWFNPAAFRRANAAGNTPRNFLRGPSQKRVDLSLSKSFGLGGETRAELRAESSTSSIGSTWPCRRTTWPAPTSAPSTTIGGPRVAQVGVRLTF